MNLYLAKIYYLGSLHYTELVYAEDREQAEEIVWAWLKEITGEETPAYWYLEPSKDMYSVYIKEPLGVKNEPISIHIETKE